MVEGLLNLILEPFYTAFEVFDPSTNLFQIVVILMFIIGVINWLFQFLK